ncbi:uncharacterized protein TNCV_2823791 [Trichonephila clavipes]|nr:uncharacterized protein TNCV_2823791 [Trichonephila clavipes]
MGVLFSPSSRKSSRRLLEGKERWEAHDHLQIALPQNWGRNEPNSTVFCIVLKATANDRRHLALFRDESLKPRSDLCRSGGISSSICDDSQLLSKLLLNTSQQPTQLSRFSL